MTEFLRMSGMYWGVTALDLLDNVDKIDQDEIVEYIKKCQCPISGGVSPCEGHDPHLLYTLSAVQVRVALYSTENSIDGCGSQRAKLTFACFVLTNFFRFSVSMIA